MTTRELISPDRPPLDAAQAALKVWFTTRRDELGRREWTFYDTFDGLLHEADVELRVDGPPQTPLPPAAIPDPARRAQVIALAGIRALLPIAHLKVTTETLSALDALQKTVARVHAYQPTVITDDGTEVQLASRLIVEELRGYEQERDKVYELLHHLAEITPAKLPLRDEAIQVSGGVPGGFSTSINVRMSFAERGDVVVARVLRRLLEVMDATLPGTIAGTDPEFLHDYRVSVRRTRAVLKEMPGVFPADDVDTIKQEFKWVQAITGETRDLDVWSLEFDELKDLAPESLRPHLQPLRAVIDHHHQRARTEMERRLRSDRAQELRDYWSNLLQVLVLENESGRPDAARPIGELVGRRIRKVHRKMIKMGSGIDPDSPPQDYHDLRKRGKELRYLLEMFGQRLFDPDQLKPIIKALKRLQDVLGRHQDREVQIEALKQLGPEVMQQPDGARALMAIGALIERLEADAADARSEFAENFKEFAHASAPLDDLTPPTD